MDTSNRINVTNLIWPLVPATIVSTVGNTLFYYFVTKVLGFELLVPNDPEIPPTVPLPVFDVVLFSIIWAIAAGIVFLIVVARSQTPVRRYIIISTAVLIASFALPLKMPSDKVIFETKGTLITMHIIGAVLVVGILVGLYQRHSGANHK